MAIPDSPLTRSEEYLNNIATGEGAIPDVPLTRIEQYLDYIAKNGGSGGGGSGGGVMVVHAADTEIGGFSAKILDKTAGEIIAAAKTGYVVLDMYNGTEEGSYMMPFTTVWFDTKSEELVIGFGGFGQGGSFSGTASTENDYPVDTSGK